MMVVLYVQEVRGNDEAGSLATANSNKLRLKIRVEGALGVAQNS